MDISIFPQSIFFIIIISVSSSPHVFPSSSLTQFKLPTSAPPTTKPNKVITTFPTTTAALTTTTTTVTTTTIATTTTAAPLTVATTQEPTTPPAPTTPPTTTINPEPTTPPTTLPPQPAGTLPSTTPAPTTLPPPGVTTRKEKETKEGELIVFTQSDTEDAEATPSVVIGAMDFVPVTIADGVSGDVDPVMPLIIPPQESDSTSLEVETESPPSDTQEAEGALSLTEPPTPASSDFPLPTPFPVSEPEDSETSIYMNLTQTPTSMPRQDSQTEAGSPGTKPGRPKEEMDIHVESAVQLENDTATFSAATVLSGDGEVDHAPSSYPQLLDTDSELDYQYDPADTFLPVSSAASLLLLHLLLPLLLLFLKAAAASKNS